MRETTASRAALKQQDGEVAGVCWSRFQRPGTPASLTLVIIPGTAHSKIHFEGEAWLEALTQAGHPVMTFTPDRRHRLRVRLEDLVQDVFSVMRAAELLPPNVVLVGHSLGGGVALEAARRERFAGVVVLASLAPSLWRGVTVRGLPANFLQYPLACLKAAYNPAEYFRNPHLARKLLFRPQTPPAVVAACLSHICDEAPRALYQLLLGGKTRPLATPCALFVSGAEDGSVPTEAVEQSAHLYQQLGCDARFIRLSATPHDLMLDGAGPAATAIREFVQALSKDERRGLSCPHSP